MNMDMVVYSGTGGLAKIDPDTLSPKEAQEFLYHLKHLVSKPRKGK